MLLAAFDSGWISSKGEYLAKFEKAFADHLGVEYAIACSSGTAALHLAMLAVGIAPGDPVIVPSLTYIATANAVRYCDGQVVLADSNVATWNLRTSTLGAGGCQFPRAIVPVHLYGNPCDMTDLREASHRTNAYLIEDASEAIGAAWRGKPAGAHGDIGTFSFFGNKTITTGEGGMFVTNNPVFAQRARLYWGQGQGARTYDHEVVGYNYRMTNLQAALGLAQLQRLDEILEQKRRVYTRYCENLHGFCTPQALGENGEHGHWMFAAQFPDRDEVISRLKCVSVETRPVFYPLDQMFPYRGRGRCPTAMELHTHGVVLPSGPQLSNEKIDWICEQLTR